MKLLIEEAPLQVLPTLAKRIGLNEAIVLQQLHYLLRRSKGAPIDLPIEAPKDEPDALTWRKVFPFWGPATIKRTFAELRKRKLVVVEQPHGTDRRNRYAIDYEALELLDQVDPHEGINVIPSNGSDRSAGGDQVETLEGIESTPSSGSERSSVVDAVNDRGTATTESETTSPTLPPTSEVSSTVSSVCGGGADQIGIDSVDANGSQHASEFQPETRAAEMLELLGPVLERRTVERPKAKLTRDAVAAIVAAFPNIDHLSAADDLAFWLEFGGGEEVPIVSMAQLCRKFVRDGVVIRHEGLEPTAPMFDAGIVDAEGWIAANTPYAPDSAHFHAAFIRVGALRNGGHELDAAAVCASVESRYGPYRADAA